MNDINKVLKLKSCLNRLIPYFYVMIPVTIKPKHFRDFPGGAVVKNLPANAGDAGSSPGPESSHMPWSN